MKYLLIVMILFSFAVPHAWGQQTQIVAFVNEDVITSHDLSQRVKILRLLGALSQDAEPTAADRRQILDGLIIQQLKLQLMEQFNATPPPDAVEGEYRRLTNALKTTPDELDSLLVLRGIDAKTVENLVISNVGWQIYSRRFIPRVIPSQQDADAAYQSALNKLSQPQYLIDEIVLRVASILDDNAKQRQAEAIIAELRSGADFGIVARNVSDAPSAANGGARGWVAQSDLPPDVVDALQAMPAGGVTALPIRTQNSYLIVRLRERRQPEAGYRQFLDYRLELFGSDEESQLNAAASAEQDIAGCAFAVEQGVNLQEFSDMPPPDVPTSLQNQMVRLKDGERSDVFFYQGQWAILTLCRRQEQGTPPIDRDQIFNRIGFERLNQYVIQHLEQERREAFIEIRL